MKDHPHLSLYTFRINQELKSVAQKALGDKLPEICREAILKALDKERDRRYKRKKFVPLYFDKLKTLIG